MRNDFMLMKDLAVHTRVDPQARNQSLLRFMGSIQRCVWYNCITNSTKFNEVPVTVMLFNPKDEHNIALTKCSDFE